MAHPLEDSDLYNRVGGQAALTQLIDPTGTGTWSAETIELVKQDAWNFVVAAVSVQVELSGLTMAQIRAGYGHLITLASQKGIRLLWNYGTSGQACPPRIVDMDALADQQLQMLAERRRKHGDIGTSPTPSQAVQQVDMNPYRDRMTLSGFRTPGGLI